MKFLRTLSTRHLLALTAAAVAVAVGGAALAVAASGGRGPTPAPKPLARALHDSLAARNVAGVTARIRFTNNLFPSGSLIGNNLSALMSGASGRLWLTNDGRGRLELQSDAGDAQIVWNHDKLTVYDASSNTVYNVALPSGKSGSSPADNSVAPSVADISALLAKVGQHADVSGAKPTNVGGQPAYSVTISPKHDGGLLGHAELAWDAAHSVPLRVGIYAQGSSKPVLELAATHISYGTVSSSDVEVTPPPNAKKVDLSAPGTTATSGENGNPVTGLAAVQAAVGFHVVAPDTLVGLPRKDVRAVGGANPKGALVVYGQGLGAIVIFEHKADAAGKQGGVLSGLPTVSLDGLTGHELATQLATALEWQRGGVAFVLAGSLPPAAAESAARALR